MTKIRVSVVIPMFDAEKYIRSCLLSIMGQTLVDIEILVVNDGSGDNSPNIVHDLSRNDSRITLYNIENSGTASARNHGIKNSRGKYISFIDSDDFIEPNMLERMYSKAMKESSDIVVCGYKKVSDDGLVKELVVESCNSKDAFFKELLSLSSPSPIWNKIYRRALFDNTECMFPSAIRNNEDNAALFKIVYFSNKVSFLDSCYYNWRQTPNSKCRSISRERLDDSVKVLLERRAFLLRENSYEENESSFLHSCVVMILVRLSHIGEYGVDGEKEHLFKHFINNVNRYELLSERHLSILKTRFCFLYWRLLFQLVAVGKRYGNNDITAGFPCSDVAYCVDNYSPELAELQSVVNQVHNSGVKEAYVFGVGTNWDKIKDRLKNSVKILGFIDEKAKEIEGIKGFENVPVIDLDGAYEHFNRQVTIIVSSVYFAGQICDLLKSHPRHDDCCPDIICFCPV